MFKQRHLSQPTYDTQLGGEGLFKVYLVLEQVMDDVEAVLDHGFQAKGPTQAITHTPSGSPMGWSISGQNSPESPISVHFFRSGWYGKISILGSAYGLYAGFKRI